MCVGDQCFALVYSTSGGDTGRLCFGGRVSIFRVRTLGLTLNGCTDNDGFQVISLLKALSVDWTFFRVKTQDLAMLVGLDDDGVYA
jgi:hypothetical protein